MLILVGGSPWLQMSGCPCMEVSCSSSGRTPGRAEDAGRCFLGQPLCFASPSGLSIDPSQLCPWHRCPYIVSRRSLPLFFPRGLHFLTLSLTAEQIPFHGTIAPWPIVLRPRRHRAKSPSPVRLFLWNNNHHLSGVESP